MTSIGDQPILQLDNIRKVFGTVVAVDDLSLEVSRGEVFGFLGPNGSGKSTTIRMILSLIKPTSGSIQLFGHELNGSSYQLLSRIGAIVEKPDFYLTMSARQNLSLLGSISGKEISANRIEEVLELVGLLERSQSKVKTFSYGMKQRLGIAQALLHDPELVILDEPTNGLDPQGVKEVRDLIFYLSRDLGKTVFVSSHVLAEIELMATHMAIINRGKTVIQGKVSELLHADNALVEFTVGDVAKAMDVISGSLYFNNTLAVNDASVAIELPPEAVHEVNALLVESGIRVSGITRKRSLEEYFLRITQEHLDSTAQSVVHNESGKVRS